MRASGLYRLCDTASPNPSSQSESTENTLPNIPPRPKYSFPRIFIKTVRLAKLHTSDMTLFIIDAFALSFVIYVRLFSNFITRTVYDWVSLDYYGILKSEVALYIHKSRLICKTQTGTSKISNIIFGIYSSNFTTCPSLSDSKQASMTFMTLLI